MMVRYQRSIMLDSSILESSLSIVIPILDERDSLVELHTQLTNVLARLHNPYEIIFVDDGSTDGSLSVCRELAECDPHTRLIELRRHFGKSTALQAGFELAQGEVIITLDGDLQDDPEEIPNFLAALAEGYDLVSGWKRERHDPVTKTIPSRFFNLVTSRLTGISLRDFNCGYKAYRREVIKGLDVYGEMHRYIPILAYEKGFRAGEIPVRHHPRKYGRSKYSFERFLRGPFDLLTVLFLISFKRRPLHLFGMLGLSFFFVGFIIDLYLSILWFLGDRPIGNRPLLTLGTLLITLGIQVLIFGLLAEMMTASSYRRTEVLDLIRHTNGAVQEPERRTMADERPRGPRNAPPP